MLIRVICGEKSLSLHIAKLKTTKITLYNGKEIQKNHRHIGTAVCERSCPYRSLGWCIRTGRYLCALSASEKRRCIIHRRFGRTRGTYHDSCQERRNSLPTVISPENVPTAIPKALTATNAKNAEPHFLQRILSTRKAPSAAANR